MKEGMIIFLFLISILYYSRHYEDTLQILKDSNYSLSTGENIPKNELRYEYIPEIKEKNKGYQEEYLSDPDYFLQQIIEQAEIYQPLVDLIPETVPVKGRVKELVVQPYNYWYASFPLENEIVLTLKVRGDRTNHYYDFDKLSLINQCQDWENFYYKQEEDDASCQPIDWQGFPYHKHYVPLVKPRKYLQAVLAPKEPSKIEQIRDPRSLDLQLIYTQDGKSVYIPIWNRDSLKYHLLKTTSEYIITGVK
jgi:hypothetical protein